MKKQLFIAVLSVGVLSGSASGDEPEQLGQLGGAVRRVQQLRDIQMSDAEERQLGAAVSERIRARYGVVQDPAVHRYVALVGTALAQVSDKPNVAWTFIVLDTDGVNAFAAPGGFVHITRGALALAQDEAELAGVLGHEIVHIAEQHTIRSIQKSKAIQMGADETLSGNASLFNRLVDNVYLSVIENSFGRAEENESDEKAIAMANRVGYAPQGLGGFLTRLQERNKDAQEKRGLFASHPEMNERLGRLQRQITAQKLAATAVLEDRYRKHISYTPVPAAGIALVDGGAAGLAGGDKGEAKPAEPSNEKPAEAADAKPAEEAPRKRGFGGITRMVPGGGGEKKSTQVTASAAARGVDPERDAKGGSNPALVAVTVSAADLAAFKKEGGLS
jgi:beta-barrel assembly-enhancing protease